MPQMAPISWLTLFFLFSFAFIIFNILNYYCFNNRPFFMENKGVNNNESEIDNNSNNSMNWKW